MTPTRPPSRHWGPGREGAEQSVPLQGHQLVPCNFAPTCSSLSQLKILGLASHAATYARAYADCLSSNGIEATTNLFNQVCFRRRQEEHCHRDPWPHLVLTAFSATTISQATSSRACNGSLFGFLELDGGNTTSVQCPEECKSVWEVGAAQSRWPSLHACPCLAHVHVRIRLMMASKLE